ELRLEREAERDVLLARAQRGGLLPLALLALLLLLVSRRRELLALMRRRLRADPDDPSVTRRNRGRVTRLSLVVRDRQLQVADAPIVERLRAVWQLVVVAALLELNDLHALLLEPLLGLADLRRQRVLVELDLHGPGVLT